MGLPLSRLEQMLAAAGARAPYKAGDDLGAHLYVPGLNGANLVAFLYKLWASVTPTAWVAWSRLAVKSGQLSVQVINQLYESNLIPTTASAAFAAFVELRDLDIPTGAAVVVGGLLGHGLAEVFSSKKRVTVVVDPLLRHLDTAGTAVEGRSFLSMEEAAESLRLRSDGGLPIACVAFIDSMSYSQIWHVVRGAIVSAISALACRGVLYVCTTSALERNIELVDYALRCAADWGLGTLRRSTATIKTKEKETRKIKELIFLRAAVWDEDCDASLSLLSSLEYEYAHKTLRAPTQPGSVDIVADGPPIADAVFVGNSGATGAANYGLTVWMPAITAVVGQADDLVPKLYTGGTYRHVARASEHAGGTGAGSRGVAALLPLAKYYTYHDIGQPLDFALLAALTGGEAVVGSGSQAAALPVVFLATVDLLLHITEHLQLLAAPVPFEREGMLNRSREAFTSSGGFVQSEFAAAVSQIIGGGASLAQLQAVERAFPNGKGVFQIALL